MDSDAEPDITDNLLQQQDADSDAEMPMRKAPAKKSATKAKAGTSFEGLSLSTALLKTLHQRGFRTPTPIQRLAMPAILDSPPRDVVGMARTGSGKTLAYMVPLIQRLGSKHSPTFGARALVLLPTRELALQVLKVGKDISRGAKEANHESLRWGMVVGGEGLDEQFDTLASNPDVIIATPGRLLHVAVESNMDFRSIQYVVFDEADRLFEMGFSIQLHELLNRLPSTRQTLLFSATLPKTLVEFAKAGLQNPKLVRLDADAKISSDLQMSFLTIKANEKEAALLCLLRDIIKVPFHKEQPVDNGKGKKRKREDDPLPPHQSIIFAATKHHVEYLTTLLEAAGYSVSQIYGSLDQTNRKMQLASFRSGRTSLLVVTDLAARGIDIPLLQNVVNYDFPVGGRSFVHRVGRTARAGRKGWAYSFVTATDMPHLLDLETFLGRPLQAAPFTGVVDYSNRLVLGGFPRDTLENENEHIRNVLIEPSPTLIAQQNTALKGQKMYEKSTSKASPESYRRSKEFLSKHAGLFGALSAISMLNPVFEQISSEAQSRAALLAKINSFTPNETIFEMGTRGKTPAALVMHARRKVMQVGQARRAQKAAEAAEDGEEEQEKSAFVTDDVEMAEEEELQDAFEVPADWRDKSVYMDYVVEGAQQEKGYALNSGSFVADATKASFTLGQDEEGHSMMAPQKASTLRWDRKNKRVVKGDGGGADNKKLIRTESGARLPASYRSGKFEEWKQKKRTSIPRVGEAEDANSKPMFGAGKRWKHKGVQTSKAFDKSGETKTKSSASRGAAPRPGKGQGQGGTRNMDQIVRNRKLKENRTRRSTQPGKRKPTGGGGGGGKGGGKGGRR